MLQWVGCGGGCGWLVVMMGGCWWWLMVVGCDIGQMLWLFFFFFFFLILKRGWERVWQGKGEEREKKNHIQSYSNHAYMHGYCINFAYMQSYAKFYKHWCRLFYAILYKFLHILYFAPTGADAPSVCLVPN